LFWVTAQPNSTGLELNQKAIQGNKRQGFLMGPAFLSRTPRPQTASISTLHFPQGVIIVF
jgi:hypothetical protein